MPIWRREPNKQEVKAFGRGARTSGKAAEAHAKAARDKAATRRGVAEQKRMGRK